LFKVKKRVETAIHTDFADQHLSLLGADTLPTQGKMTVCGSCGNQTIVYVSFDRGQATEEIRYYAPMSWS
jgi:hypothetical protein